MKQTITKIKDVDLGLLGCHVVWTFKEISNTLNEQTSALKVEAVCSSEMLLSTQKSSRRYNPEDEPQHLHRRENLTSHKNRLLYVYTLARMILTRTTM